jgi:hypothetical protein
MHSLRGFFAPARVISLTITYDRSKSTSAGKDQSLYQEVR